MWVCYLSHLSLADEPVFCLPSEGSRIDLTWREGNTRRRRRRKKKGETVEEVESPWKWPVFIRRQNPFTLFCRCEKHATTFQGGVLARLAPPLFFCHFRVLFFFSSFYSSLTGGAQRLLSLFLFSIVGTVGVNAHVKTFTILPSFFSSIPRHLRPSAFDHDPYRSAFWFTKNGDVRWNQAEGKGESWGHRFPWHLVCVFLFVLVIIIIAACQ